MVVDDRRDEVDSAKLFGAENAQLAASLAVALSRAQIDGDNQFIEIK